MALGQFEAPSFAYPQGATAMQAAFDEINKAGGIDGKTVELIVCNDQQSPDLATQCAREAVDEDVVAVIGSYSVQARSFLPVLEAAQIPFMGELATNSTEGSSEVSFPLEGNYTNYAALGYGAGLNGCTQAGLVTQDYGESTEILNDISSQAFTAASGGEVVKIAMVPSGVADYAASVASLISAGAECFIVPLPPADIIKFVKSVRQSSVSDATISVVGSSVTSGAMKSLGDDANGMILGSLTYSVDDTTVPEVQEVISKIKAFDPETDINAFSIMGWAAVDILAEAMKRAQESSGEITSATVLEEMGKFENYETGIEPPYTTTKDGPLADVPRVFSMNVLVYEWQDGGVKRVTPDFVDLADAVS